MDPKNFRLTFIDISLDNFLILGDPFKNPDINIQVS